MATADTAVAIEGLAQFQRDVKRIQPELRRDVPLALRAGVERATLPAARADTPHRSGELARSLRISATATGVTVRSRLPYANVIHWGGTTGIGHSRSTPGATRIKATKFITRAVEATTRPLLLEIEHELDKTFRRNGW